MIEDKLLSQQWFLLEKLYHYPPITLSPPIEAMSKEFSDIGFFNIPHAVMEYKDGRVKMYYLDQEWHDAALATLEKIKKTPEVLDELHKESDEELVPKVRHIADKIMQTDLSALKSEELLSLYKELYPIKVKLQLIRGIVWGMETSGEIFSKYLIEYIEKVLNENNIDKNPALVFSALTNPTKPALGAQEHIGLLKLAKDVKEGKWKLAADAEKIKQHVLQFGFLPFGCEGPSWTGEDIVKHINEILHSGVEIDIDEQISTAQNQFEEYRKKKDELYLQIPIDDKHKHMLQVASDTVYQKAWSKEHQFLSWYVLDILLQEIARRLFLTIAQVRYLLPQELEGALLRNEFDVDTLNERYRYSVIVFAKNQKPEMVTGDKAKKIVSKMNIKQEVEEDYSEVTEFVGQPAYPGKATGKVVIVNTIEDMKKMQQGDILVSEMTIPEIVAAMKKAAAFVTDMGGITCHAAIVARELGTPCVIGTKIATKVLEDGDIVEVDAEQGIVKIIS